MLRINIGEKTYNIKPEVFNQYVNTNQNSETSRCFYYKKHKKKVVYPKNIKSELVIDKLQNYKQNTFYKICSIKDEHFDYYKKLKPECNKEFATELKDVTYYNNLKAYKAHSYDESGKKTVTFE